jgi:transposase InsO family protein/transposase-like protein
MELSKDVKAYLKLRKKLMALEYARRSGSVKKALKEFNVPKATYYKWKKIFDKDGADGPLKKHPVAYNHPNKIKEKVIEKVLSLRKEYQLGSWRIKWYLERYHDISISESSVSRILKRYGVERLQKKAARRALHSKRYNKSVPGHHVQVDVKVLLLKDLVENEYKRFQYTAVDDATRIRALQIYPQQNQANAIEFINYVVKKFPFRIKTIRTDRGHEFQAKFHWHVEDLGMEHHYIKVRTPQLNGKVERSHLTDHHEFYQLLTYKDDVDLTEKLRQWENFYNFERPHAAHAGKTPYEVLKTLLKT